MKLEPAGVQFRAGWFTQTAEGWLARYSQGQGEIGNTITLRSYDWDKRVIGEVKFIKKP